MTMIMTAHDNVGVVKMTGDFTADTVNDFRDRFKSWYEHANFQNVIVDMADVGFMDSTGLGTLMMVLKRIAENEGEMYLCNLQPAPNLVVEITRANLLLNVAMSFDDALKAAS